MDWLLLTPRETTIYSVTWGSYCLLAMLQAVMDHKRLVPELKTYLTFLLIRWKLAIFLPAFLFVTFAGRFTDDETWDVPVGAGMSLLTFVTAPWCLGVFYQILKKRRPLRDLWLATALLLFSSSWFYDGYLFWRDGIYTTRWLGNLILSPTVYLAAGLLWNLEAKAGSGVTLSFRRPNWPKPPVDRRFWPVLLAAALLILLAVIFLLSFVSWNF